MYKKTRSLQGSFAPFNCSSKYNRFEAFLTISVMCSVHDKLLVTVTPSSFAPWTTSNYCTFTKMGWNSSRFFPNEILSSLYLSLFSFTLLSEDHWATRSANCCALLSQPWATTSEVAVVVSSTYFHSWPFKVPLRFKSFIGARKSHGTSFVAWGTPDHHQQV